MVQIDRGAHILYRNNKYIDDIEFVVLEDKSATRGTFVCVLDKPLKDEMSFDDRENNNWKTSSLRKYLNEEYIEHFNKNDIVQLGNGDYITLLSKEEVKRYQDILPKYNTYWWTRSPLVYNANDACLQRERRLARGPVWPVERLRLRQLHERGRPCLCVQSE